MLLYGFISFFLGGGLMLGLYKIFGICDLKGFECCVLVSLGFVELRI